MRDPLMLSLFIAAAMAQDTIVIPAPPPGLTPLASYSITILTGVLTLVTPVLLAWLRAYLNTKTIALNTQTAAAEKSMTNASVVHAAHLADLDLSRQRIELQQATDAESPVMRAAVDYVNKACAASGIPEPAEDHTVQAVIAEVHKLQIAKTANELPSVVVSPVSAIR